MAPHYAYFLVHMDDNIGAGRRVPARKRREMLNPDPLQIQRVRFFFHVYFSFFFFFSSFFFPGLLLPAVIVAIIGHSVRPSYHWWFCREVLLFVSEGCSHANGHYRSGKFGFRHYFGGVTAAGRFFSLNMKRSELRRGVGSVIQRFYRCVAVE